MERSPEMATKMTSLSDMVFIKDIELARYGWQSVGITLHDVLKDRQIHILQDLPLGSFQEGKLTKEMVDTIFNKCSRAIRRKMNPKEEEMLVRQIKLMI